MNQTDNELSNKNKREISFEEYSKEVANRLKYYPFLNWRNKSTAREVKNFYNKMMTVSDAVSFILLK